MDIIFEEKLSGAKQRRPGLQMLDELRADDTIFVTDLTRLPGAQEIYLRY
uniref:Resolvase/invertase-type recombinase catalytic domain-containing protein n=1 Tax=Virgibacillus oceani TaxID=1479511 RepID=A0A917HEG4_9BACI|nr:hypothetical protein GCM10011398_21220 [Virgibacillus oceani]